MRCLEISCVCVTLKVITQEGAAASGAEQLARLWAFYVKAEE